MYNKKLLTGLISLFAQTMQRGSAVWVRLPTGDPCEGIVAKVRGDQATVGLPYGLDGSTTPTLFAIPLDRLREAKGPPPPGLLRQTFSIDELAPEQSDSDGATLRVPSWAAGDGSTMPVNAGPGEGAPPSLETLDQKVTSVVAALEKMAAVVDQQQSAIQGMGRGRAHYFISVALQSAFRQSNVRTALAQIIQLQKALYQAVLEGRRWRTACPLMGDPFFGGMPHELHKVAAYTRAMDELRTSLHPKPKGQPLTPEEEAEKKRREEERAAKAAAKGKLKEK